MIAVKPARPVSSRECASCGIRRARPGPRCAGCSNAFASHPTRRALHSCRRCSRPICDLCVTSYGGRFCSPDCAAAFQEFQSTVSDTPIRRRRRFSLLGCLRTFIISLILSAIIYAALTQLFHTTDPTQMLVQFKKMLRLAF